MGTNHLKPKAEYFFLSVILLISFGLNFYGLDWGLPSCWNADQSVTPALNMLKNKTFFPEDYLHPSLYYYILILFLAPYLLYQYMFYPNFDSFLSASRVSWNYMAITYPDLATGIFITARLSSVIFSLLTVLVVYRIGKIIHSSKAGLFSALILTLTMDFVNWAHMEKGISLVNLLILLSIYYVILVFKEKDIKRNYLSCCLFGGLALSVKFNGGITFLLVPAVAFWQHFRKGINSLFKGQIWGFFKTLFSGAAVYILVFLLTSPNILLNATKYYTESTAEYKNKLIPDNFTTILKIWFPNVIGLSDTLIQMFGIPLVLLVGCGLLYALFKYRRRLSTRCILIFFPLITIYFFVFSPRVYTSANSKFVAHVVPFLAVLGGIFIDDLLSGKVFPKVKGFLKIIVLTMIFIISFFYCLSLDRIFAYDDLRYHATKWLKSNIPPKSDIIVSNQLEYSIGVEALRDYNVYVLGDEPGTKGAYSFVGGKYYGIDNDNLQQIKNLNSSYVIRSCWQLKQHLSCISLDTLPGEFRLIKSFERKDVWYWRPSTGGDEPSRIEIYIRNVKK